MLWSDRLTKVTVVVISWVLSTPIGTSLRIITSHTVNRFAEQQSILDMVSKCLAGFNDQQVN